jgi:hypothetical protein
MPTLQQIRLTPLNPVLISGNTKRYNFEHYPGLAILRIDRCSFWVHDTKHQVGVVVAGWDVAKETINKLAQEF